MKERLFSIEKPVSGRDPLFSENARHINFVQKPFQIIKRIAQIAVKIVNKSYKCD